MIITYDQLSVFLLIFSRFSGMMVLAPFFSMKTLNGLAKVSLIFWSSLLVVFIIPLPQALPNSLIAYVMAMIIEIIIGVIIGFVSSLMVSAIEFSGSLMDTQAGLSSASVLDPTSGKNAALLELFMKYLSVLLFLLLNGHHMVISAVFDSFSLMPIGQPINFSQGSYYIIFLGADIFRIALQLASPIILVIFIVDFSFGILNKVAEQVNVFQLGFQVKPIVSIFIFLGIAPGFVVITIRLLEGVLDDLIKALGFFIT